ncbi:MAG: hypothetical protein HDS91_00915 [Bacteroidales bacterium]|nr:hypothetical protein [Bacteroidales bacterium]
MDEGLVKPYPFMKYRILAGSVVWEQYRLHKVEEVIDRVLLGLAKVMPVYTNVWMFAG